MHKQTTALVKRAELVATEELQVRHMSRSARGTRKKPGSRVKQKAGLNREILSAGLAMTHRVLAYKAKEAVTRLHWSDTRQLKPSQRCSNCWAIVRKSLKERTHRCECGCVLPRDQNSARVVLFDAWVPTNNTPGTGVAARKKPLLTHASRPNSTTRETPTTTASV